MPKAKAVAIKQPDSGKRGPKRTDAQREADYAIIAVGRLNGRHPESILEEINSKRPYSISLSMLKEDWREIRRRHADLEFAAYAELRQLWQDRFTHIFAEAMGAWHKSKEIQLEGGGSETTYGTGAGKNTKEKKTSRKWSRQKNREGNDEFLAKALKAGENVCRLLGLYEQPEQLGTDGKPIGLTMVFNTGKSVRELTNFPTVKLIEGKQINDRESDDSENDFDSGDSDA